MNNRTLSAALLGAFIIALAVGLICFAVTDHGVTIILWITLLIFGGALVALSIVYPKDGTKFGPSESVYRMVAGTIAATAGLMGLLFTMTEMDPIILAALFLIVLAAVIIAAALKNGKNEGK